VVIKKQTCCFPNNNKAHVRSWSAFSAAASLFCELAPSEPAPDVPPVEYEWRDASSDSLIFFLFVEGGGAVVGDEEEKCVKEVLRARFLTVMPHQPTQTDGQPPTATPHL
jgi:hypothetical protein